MRQAICAKCSVVVNGKRRLSCQTPVHGDVVLEPTRKGKVIRDLVCERGERENMPKQPEMIPVEEAREGIADMTKRVALLHMAYARTLVQELGEQRGKELIRKAIWEYGTKIGERTRQRVISKGLEPTIKNVDKGSDLPGLVFGLESVEVDGERRVRSHGCVLADVWHEYGEDELGGLYCLVDPAKTQAYCPDWTIVHLKRIPVGDEYCELAIRPTASEGEAKKR